MSKICVIIPARYASTRFPAKPLADIAGKSMIEWVYNQASKATRPAAVVVATDNQMIFDHVKSFGGNVCITSPDHASGTDRCFEALSLQPENYDYVVNVQGDEPFIDPTQIDLLCSLLDGATTLATLVKKIDKQEHLVSPHVVKVVVSKLNEALYFSRAAIPHMRSVGVDQWLSSSVYYKHIGMYAYRADVLREITQLPVGALEQAESLEQLRWLENGYKIKVAETNLETFGIDTPEDLTAALRHLESKSRS